MAFLQLLDERELTAAHLILHEQVELELSVTETILEACGLEAGVSVRLQDVSLGLMQTERRAFGFVLDVDFLQMFVHDLGKRIGLLLTNLFIGKLEVEVIEAFLHIGKADEELRANLRLFLGFLDGLDELRFVEFLSGHGNDAVDLRNHVYGRRLAVVTTHFDEVVHVVAIQAGICGNIGAITFAKLQFVDLQEMLIGFVEFVLCHKLVVVKVREEHALVRLVKREAEAALRSYIAELLIESLIPVEGIHVFVHVYLRVAAFPCGEVLQPRPVILRQQASVLLQKILQFLCAFGLGEDVRA